jgi:hypothetical protein
MASVLGYALVPLFQIMIYDKKTARAFFSAIFGSWAGTKHAQENR